MILIHGANSMNLVKELYTGNLEVSDSGTDYDLEFDDDGTLVTATYEYER